MKAEYSWVEAMTMIGFSITVPIKEGFRECPALWGSYVERFAAALKTGAPNTEEERAVLHNGIGSFALCIPKGELLEYAIVGKYNGGVVPNSMMLFTLPGGAYAVFRGRGPLPGSLQRLNETIWSEWMPEEGYALGAGSTMIEVYSDFDPQSADYTCEMWIPLERMPDSDKSPITKQEPIQYK